MFLVSLSAATLSRRPTPAVAAVVVKTARYTVQYCLSQDLSPITQGRDWSEVRAGIYIGAVKYKYACAGRSRDLDIVSVVCQTLS
ncbi:hypothetical protein J6590_022605 [Homalodisca vitripennis]|nr:hypothetical protein J6590_022605 [Homalodisca vitripennis]